jgi:hypothetical protein
MGHRVVWFNDAQQPTTNGMVCLLTKRRSSAPILMAAFHTGHLARREIDRGEEETSREDWSFGNAEMQHGPN